MLALEHANHVGTIENQMFEFVVQEALQIDANKIRAEFPQRILDFGCGKFAVLNRIAARAEQKQFHTQLFGYAGLCHISPPHLHANLLIRF